MRCTRPRTVGFKADGKTICWSQKDFSKEFSTFQLPCGKCIECRLDYARQWAVRCVHEAQMHPKNSFITLTYDDQHLQSPKLIYADFQNFMKRLRKTQNDPIGVFVTGEYGEKTKRPHFHAILFNYRPSDCKLFRRTERGDEVFSSESLKRLWPHGFSEIGDVTFESAGYCARYAAKKLVHGPDGHDWQPISKKSSKHAIGKKWLERFWPDVFLHGRVVLRDGTEIGIPRYYEKWFKKEHPDLWLRYVTDTKLRILSEAEKRSHATQTSWEQDQHRRLDEGKFTFSPTENERREIITESKFKMLQDYLKL